MRVRILFIYAPKNTSLSNQTMKNTSQRVSRFLHIDRKKKHVNVMTYPYMSITALCAHQFPMLSMRLGKKIRIQRVSYKKKKLYYPFELYTGELMSECELKF